LTAFFRWGGRPPDEGEVRPAAEPQGEPASASKVLPKFLAAVARHPSPVLLDIGPVTGANVSLLGERLACKIIVDDLYEEIERQARAGGPAQAAGALVARLPPAGSVDGVLCWDVFDYLDPGGAAALAAALVGALRRGGVLHGFFATAPLDAETYTRFVVEAEDAIRHQPYPATRRRRSVLSPRDIGRLFNGLDMVESVLLKTNSREVLFRKA
jgi:hypothetical protein